MLTFLELYQTLLGFVFFKLYTDLGLVYPPPLDIKKAEGAAGVGAYSLQDSTRTHHSSSSASTTKKSSVAQVEVNGKTVSGKDVRKVIRSLDASSAPPSEGISHAVEEESMAVDILPTTGEVDEEFVVHGSTKPIDGEPSSNADATAAILPTLQTISALPRPLSTTLFAPYTFWLSRETSRSIFEFLVRSFGGRIGWPASSGSGSPIADESDESITHVIIDRPLPATANKRKETEEERKRRMSRKYVQPQWIVDCINAGKILLEEPYLQGKELPPHLSPFGDLEGAYDPLAADTTADAKVDEEGDAQMVEEEEEDKEGSGSESESEEDEIEGEDEPDVEEDEEDEEEEEVQPTPASTKKKDKKRKVLQALADVVSEDPAALRAAELAAEAAGMDYGTFEKEVRKSRKKNKSTEASATTAVDEADMNKMMMSNKQKKLYEKIKFSQAKKATEVCFFTLRHI
jgi:pescadillo